MNTLVKKNVSAYNIIKEREFFVKEMEARMNNQAQVFLQKQLLLHSYWSLSIILIYHKKGDTTCKTGGEHT